MGALAKNIEQNLTLAERLKKRRAGSDQCLLLDTSGSMDDFCDDSTRKIDALQKIIASLKCKHMYTFNSYAARFIAGQKLFASGGTNLWPALNLMLDDKQTSGIIITDGEISDGDLVLEFINQHPEFKLQIIYVGPIDSKPAFLDELASKTGGFCSVEDLAHPKELAEKITLLLNPGKQEDEKSIQL